MADLDVVVSAAGGEAAGYGVEVEGEHRLQVVPVDLHRAATHPLRRLLLRWDGSKIASETRVWGRRENGGDWARDFTSAPSKCRLLFFF